MKITNIYRIIIVILTIFLSVVLFSYRCKSTVVIKKEKILNPNYVFLGDSITYLYDTDKYYHDLPIVNSGINGNKTKDILSNMNDRVYKYNPSKVILLIGINNFLYENSSIEDVTKDIEKIASEIRKNKPYSKIYIESIYPINDDWRIEHNSSVPKDYELKEKIKLANKKIEKFCIKEGYKYIDMYEKMSDNKGYFNKEYTDDGLHPNENGYKVITKELKKVLNL